MAEGVPVDSPTLADQVSELYELVAGYHATHLLEIARELGVWGALAKGPGSLPKSSRRGLAPARSPQMCSPDSVLVRAA